MSIEVKVPVLPESVADATVAAWHKQPGDSVKRDENLVDIETDKVILEVPAPADGVLEEILQEVGATVTANQLLAKMKAGAVAAPAPVAATPAAEETAEAPLSPAVRKLVEEHKLDAASINGTGKGGRLLKEDVLKHLESQPAAQTTSTAPQLSAAEKAPVHSPERLTSAGDRPEKHVPMTRLRQRIAERLVEAQQTSAILTTFNEVNMQPIIDLRSKYKEQFEKTHDVRLGFMSFFVRASVEALKRFPEINASIDGSDIVYHGYQDIGVAVSSPRGLVVPVLRNAEHMSMADVEQSITNYGKQAQDGKLAVEDLMGGTFTISNGGVYGSMMSTPILNPPQAAILGMHKTQERAVVENGEIVARPMMYLALSYDHRIIDGKEAVQFLVTIKELLEEPARIMLNI
jgi:2-oxoglutarate dehydrogenase E2 component (dihydrolipoamide succinyltransferase)